MLTPPSQAIMARSPYLEAKVNRWSEDKKELIVEDCDLVTFNILVDYMYDIKIPEPVICQESLNKLLEMSDKWNVNLINSSLSLASTGSKSSSRIRLFRWPSSEKCLFMSVARTV